MRLHTGSPTPAIRHPLARTCVQEAGPPAPSRAQGRGLGPLQARVAPPCAPCSLGNQSLPPIFPGRLGAQRPGGAAPRPGGRHPAGRPQRALTAMRPQPLGARDTPRPGVAGQARSPGAPPADPAGRSSSKPECSPKIRGRTRQHAQHRQPAWCAISLLMGHCSMVNGVPPQIHVHSEAQSMASFGNRVFADVIKYR